MSLTIEKIPPRVHFASNALPFEISSNNMFESSGEKFFIVMNRGGAIAQNETILFEWGDNIVTITAKNAPDDSGSQLISSATAAQFFSVLSSNYLLSKDFVFTLSGNEVSMEARHVGSEYDCDITINTAAFTKYSNTPGTSDIRRPKFAIVAMVLANDPSPNPEPAQILGTDKLTPANDAKVVFEPADYIFSWFDYTFEWPPASPFINRPKAIAAYFIKMAEQYGITPEVKKLTTSSVFYALPGALADEKQLKYNQFNQSWWERMPYTRAFMSNSPEARMSSATVPEKLWFLCWHAFQGTTKLMCKITFDDNTTFTFVAAETTMERYKVYEINCGYNFLDIAGYVESENPGHECIKWEVWLKTGLNDVSETKTFVIDDRFNMHERVFVFKNLFGFHEMIRTTGKASVTHNVSKELFYNEQPSAFDITGRTRFSKTADFAEKLELSSGYFYDYESAFWASEAFRSDEIFEIVNGLLIPVVVTSDEFPIRKDGIHQWSFMIEYARAFNGAVFPAPATQTIGGDFNEDYNDDFLIN